MMLGGRVSAPVGMVSFCQRNEGQCGAVTPRAQSVAETARPLTALAVAAPELSALSAGQPSGSLTWASKSYSPTFTPSSAPIRPQAGRRATDWSALFAVARTEQPATPAGALRLTPSVSDQTGLPLSDRLWKTLSEVNTAVNRDIIHREDSQIYGMGDFWALPTASGQRYGDCEDYVLEKRQRLIAAGVPAESLAIALVVTSYGESHAVLVIDTDKGDFVLDNLTPWINAWSTTGYRWVARQAPGGDPMNWVSVASAAS